MVKWTVLFSWRQKTYFLNITYTNLCLKGIMISTILGTIVQFEDASVITLQFPINNGNIFAAKTSELEQTLTSRVKCSVVT
jgi:hypothetical protein